MEIKTSENNNIVTATIIGKIDLYNAKEINEVFDKFIGDGKLQIIVNLEEVPFMDSSGFVGFVTWTKKFQQLGGNLKILNVTGFVKKVIEQNSMRAVLQIYDSEEAAIQSFQS